MQFLRTLFWVVIAAFVAIIASENWRDVTLDLWGNLQADIKIPVLLILTFLLGFLPTWLVMRGKLWRLKRRLEPAEQVAPVMAPPSAAPAEDGL
jgi:putative membrane protein